MQDSPQTTLLRSPAIQNYSLQLSQHILSKAITICSRRNSASNLMKTQSLEILTYTDRPERTVSMLSSNCIYDSVANSSDNVDYHPVEKHAQTCRHFTELIQPHHIYDLYASDSVLNRHIDNIYDVPCDNSANQNSSDDSLADLRTANGDRFAESDVKHCNTRNSQATKCVKAPTAKHSARDKLRANELRLKAASEIYDYEVYYHKKRTCQSFVESDTTSSSRSDKTCASIQKKNAHLFHTNASTTSSSTNTSMTTLQRRKTPSILYSPLHYHASSNLSTGNRPNSRNSLNSRLSSSHNSLTISSSNKADDSIFITQAMSHDALTGREISDFYNVPIDSDIYALPIDVIRPISFGAGNGGGFHRKRAGNDAKSVSAKSTPAISITSSSSKGVSLMPKHLSNGSTSSLSLLKPGKAFHGRLKYVRNNKKRKGQPHGSDPKSAGCSGSQASHAKGDKRHSVPDNAVDPMHMMLDEVKRCYFYSTSDDSVAELTAIAANASRLRDSGSSAIDEKANFNNNNDCSSNNNIGKPSNAENERSSNDNNNNGAQNNFIISNNKANTNHSQSMNNNCESSLTSPAMPTVLSTPNHSNMKSNSKLSSSRTNSGKHGSKLLSHNAKENEYISAAASAITGATKKSQFSIPALNLKQKFCSIFRFRKSYQTHQLNATARNRQRNSVADVYESSIDNSASESKRKIKFLTRALPPLPPKGKLRVTDS